MLVRIRSFARVGALSALAACSAQHATTSRSNAPLPPRVGANAPQVRKPVAIAKAAPPHTTCEYHVSAPAEPPFVVHVAARCEGGGVTGFVAMEPAAGPFVRAEGANEPGVYQRAKLAAPGAVELSYTVDLEALAQRTDDVDIARRFGRSLLAPASSFLLRPDPEADDQPISVHFDSPRIESGLKRSGDAYSVLSHELKVATYTTFGAREARDLEVEDSTLRLVVLDGALDRSFDELASWVTQAAHGVADFFGRPPASRTLVVLAPLPGRHGIPFGKLLPANAPGVIVLIGEHTQPKELTDDWVLVHELFHVGTPSFIGEGKWYDEGLATYFEPLIRARLGWYSEAGVWHEFLTNMPRGLEAMTRRGLEHPERYSDTYWGGGLFCLLADVEVNRSNRGIPGLEDGVDRVFNTGGDASQVWPLARALEVADEAFERPVLAQLAAAHAERGSPVDLTGLFRELGVALDRKGQVHFDDKAPLAGYRHRLVSSWRPQLAVPSAH